MGIVQSIVNKAAFPTFAIPKIEDQPRDERIVPVRVGLKLHHIHLSVNETKSETGPSTTVIYCHGNCESIYLADGVMDLFSRLFGMRFVCFDWCGYGKSTGKPSERALIASVEGVYQYVKRTFNCDDQHIIVWGRSIGTVAAAALAKSHPLRCILQSPPASAFDTIWDEYRCGCCNKLCTFKRVTGITGDLVIVHGDQDDVVPYRNGLKLAMCYAGMTDVGQFLSAQKQGADGIQEFACKKMTFRTIVGAQHNDIEQLFIGQLIWCVKDVLRLDPEAVKLLLMMTGGQEPERASEDSNVDVKVVVTKEGGRNQTGFIQ